jgi:hypothetical protein
MQLKALCIFYLAALKCTTFIKEDVPRFRIFELSIVIRCVRAIRLYQGMEAVARRTLLRGERSSAAIVTVS